MRLTKPVDWVSETKFVVDGLEFRSDLDSYTEQTTPTSVVILKESRLLREYLDFLAAHDIANVFEFGVWQGGSPLFYALATDARKIVAIDHLHKGPRPPEADHDDVLARAYKNPALDEIIEQRGIADRVKLHFSVSQDDRKAVSGIIDHEFGDAALDLVIDDASHYYAHSRTSFETAFPRLREGGLYIIEDWQWAHSPHYQSGGTFEGRPALTNLVFELLVAYGSHPDLFWNMVVRDWFVAVQKGSKPLAGDFKLDDLLRMRGKQLTLI
ncbi:MAG: class I SAM-dependent methyltransferase [Alphaproteobacteria bacterium]|nr:class I SAM-dependent methyltransferase [Alphaproteobacteria bacterium]